MLFPSPPLEHGDWNAAHYGRKALDCKWDYQDPRVGAKSEKRSRYADLLPWQRRILGTLGPTLEEFRDRWQAHVVGFDFADTGAREETPSETNILEDSRAVGRWVREQSKFVASRYWSLEDRSVVQRRLRLRSTDLPAD